jgi:uroporphyrin-III C-methyltransferase/precorrin-2 dehydrogenase/sirohydrochlorin ferrochelatase
MDYLPIFIGLRDRRALVVGGGEAAARKIRLLAKAGAAIVVVAAETCDEIASLAASAILTLARRDFEPADLTGCALAFAATEDPAIDDVVAVAAAAAGVPVNVVDRPERSSFIMPAIVDRDPVVVAIGSAGAAPVLVRKLRAQIEQLLPARLGALARFAARFRRGAQALIGTPVARRRFWERFFDGPIAARVLAGDERGAAEAMLPVLNRAPSVHGDDRGVIYLVGTGPGDPDLLTLRALQLMAEADVVLVDFTLEPAILERVRRDAIRIPIAERSATQIEALAVAEARKGSRVLRLVAGQGIADAERLRRQGVAVVAVPGVATSAQSLAADVVPFGGAWTHQHHQETNRRNAAR